MNYDYEAMKKRCLKEWETVNDPPCHPSDPHWKGCFSCLFSSQRPEAAQELPASPLHASINEVTSIVSEPRIPANRLGATSSETTHGKETEAQHPVQSSGHPIWPKVNGVGRMFDNDRAILVMMERKPTDDELRAFHDALKENHEL